jgi:hypothetical protein
MINVCTYIGANSHPALHGLLPLSDLKPEANFLLAKYNQPSIPQAVSTTHF